MKRVNLMIVPALSVRKFFSEFLKCVIILQILAVVTAGCNKSIQIKEENGEELPVLNVNFTPCQQRNVKSSELSGKVDVKFTNEGVKITYYNFVVTCDFSNVNVTHTFVNGFLNITQQGAPNQANCICYTDVSYTINGISKNEVNVIFINDEQVYCYNDNNGNEEKPCECQDLYDEGKENQNYGKPYGGQGVYVAFYELINGGGPTGGKLWKNGVTQPVEITYVTSVFATDNDVYVAGFVPWQAMLWKNGKAQLLSSCQSFANSVFVSDNDVYVAGSEYRIKNAGVKNAGFSHFDRYLNLNYQLLEKAEVTAKSSSEETQYIGVAKLWKNGVGQDLSDGTCETSAFSVYVSGSDVYVVGRNHKANSVAKLWKNGKEQDLTDGRYEAWANFVFVLGNDVYIALCENNASGRTVAKLWKNGAVQNLTDGTRDGYATSIYVSGNDVYITGYERNAQGYNVAKLWKNGVAQNLIDGNLYSEAQSVYVSGNDVYVVGYGHTEQNFNNIVKLWKNGIAQDLTDGSKSGCAYSVFVR